MITYLVNVPNKSAKKKKSQIQSQPLPGQSVLIVPTFPNLGRPHFTPGGNNLASKAYQYFAAQAGFRHDHGIELKDTGLQVCYKEVIIGQIAVETPAI